MHAEVSLVSNFTFETHIRNHSFKMDVQNSAGGANLGPTPKEMLLASIIGCTAMDIVAVLKKHKVTPTKLVIQGDAEPRSEHPRIYNGIDINFIADGEITAEQLNEAAHLSMTKFCGVSAMITKVVPIRYKVTLNGKEVGTGEANFNI